MHQISLQFHAEYVELTRDLLPEWLSGMEYFVATVTSLAGSTEVMEMGGLDLCRAGFVPQILIREQPFDVSMSDNFVSFLRANTGFLSVQPGRLANDRLRETVIGAVAAEARLLDPWRAVLKRARTDLLSGAVQVGPTGATRDDPRHQYSSGARDLARSGVILLAAAGSVRFDLPDTQ